jgi:hypothetical protein
MSDSENTAFGAGALPVAQSSTGFQPSDDAADAALAADGGAPSADAEPRCSAGALGDPQPKRWGTLEPG